MSEILCKLQYTFIERSIHWHEQRTESVTRHVFLYEHAIETDKHTFTMQEVLDISYRPFSSGSGLFYLHTNQGVFTYETPEDPSYFINQYRKIKHSGSSFHHF